MATEQITNQIKPKNKSTEILKKHFAHCFDKQGNFDFVKFKQEIANGKEINFSNESYRLDWLGKSYARLLASDEATTLLKEDEAWNVKPENSKSENLLIKGDNLEVLKHLSHAYHEKVKMIYIDPPYNTGGDDFVYEDNRKFSVEELAELAGIEEPHAKRILDFTQSKRNTHSAWLTFIYPRLYIAKELLKEDGVIFVSIDDHEVAQLRLLMDEIFGEENFVGSLIWRKKTGASDSKSFSIISENILVYVKNIYNANSIFTKNRNSFDPKRYRLIDEHFETRGKHYVDNLDRGGISYSDSLNYAIKCPDGTKTYPNGRKKFKNDGWVWTWGKEKLEWGIKNDFIVFKKSKKKESGWGIYYKNYMYVNNKNEPIKKSAPHKNLILDIINTEGTKEISNIFNEKIFTYPKPSKLLKTLISYIKKKPNDLILDFFAGSGTTGDAVMQLNAEDGGNRKYILVQLPEKINPKKSKAAYDFVKEELKVAKPTIFEITKERLVRAAKKIVEDNNQVKEPKDLTSQDFGFKIFETVPLWENYILEEDSFDPQITLFNSKTLTPEKIKTLLTTWKTYDGLPLPQSLEPIELDGYRGYYATNTLYLVDQNFQTQHLKKLIEKIDADPTFNPVLIILFGHHFESKMLREATENIKNYANKKESDIAVITRY